MDINELRESMNLKSDDELLGILTRRDLYSPDQIDIVIEILKSRREGGRPLGSTPAKETPESEQKDDPTALFNPEEVKEIIEKSEEIQEEKKEKTAELPKISEEYISHQKSVKEEPKKKKKNTGIIVASVVSSLVIVLVLVMVVLRPGAGIFKSNFESGNYRGAHFFYKWCSGNSVSLGNINKYFKEMSTKLIDEYLDGKIDFEKAQEKISAIKDFDEELGEKYLEELKNAEDAERLYEEGISFMESEQYYDAIKTFGGIYEGYKKYELVEKQLENAKTLLKGELEQKMQEWLENHNFQGALEYIEKIKDAFENDPEIASYEDAIAEQLEAQTQRNKSAEDFYNKGGSADSAFRDASGLTYPSKKIFLWEETGCKTVIEYGTVGSKSQLAFAIFADLGDGIKEIFSYKDAVYNIYNGNISVTEGKITISGKINANGGIFTSKADYTDVVYTLKFDGEKAYLG